MKLLILFLSPLLLIGELAWIFLPRGRNAGQKKTRRRTADRLQVLPVVVVFFPLLAFFWPLRAAEPESSVPLALLQAIYDALCRFVVEGDFEQTSRLLENYLGGAGGLGLWRLYAALLFAAAPVTTFNAVLSLFNDPSMRLRLLLFDFHREKYIFSELNENSLALARSIRKKNRRIRPCFIFCDVYPDREERGSELREEAVALGARCFRCDVTALHLRPKRKGKKKTFFLLGADERENTEQALYLLENYRPAGKSGEAVCDCDELFLFSSDPNAEMLLAVKGKGSCLKTRLINDSQRLIYRLLYEKGTELFKKADDGEISVAIVGMGRYGTELAKALLWFCQMPRRDERAEGGWSGFTLRLDCFSQEKDSEARFAGRCPEIITQNNNKVDGEASYSLNFHEEADVTTETFYREICALEKLDSVFVCLGEDALNLRTAIELRRRFTRRGMKPKILTTVYSSRVTDAFKKMEGAAKADIEFLSGLESGLTVDLLFDEKLEAATLKIQIKYLEDAEKKRDKKIRKIKEENFEKRINKNIEMKYDEKMSEEEIREQAIKDLQNEYNYRSSAGRALYEHVRGRLYPTVRVPDEPRRKYEHCRWNAYMRTEGNVYAPTRNRLAKTHPDLVNFYDLPEEERTKD